MSSSRTNALHPSVGQMGPATGFKGNDRLLLGIIMGVLAFWLFAQTTLVIAPDMQKDLALDTGLMNTAVAITALFSGIFIVFIGGLADRIGRVKIVMAGFVQRIRKAFVEPDGRCHPNTELHPRPPPGRSWRTVLTRAAVSRLRPRAIWSSPSHPRATARRADDSACPTPSHQAAPWDLRQGRRHRCRRCGPARQDPPLAAMVEPPVPVVIQLAPPPAAVPAHGRDGCTMWQYRQ